jgi:hypothetical protein
MRGEKIMTPGGRITASARRKYAVIKRDGGKFPIPPGSVGHARSALAYLNSSDLTPEEKARVRRRALAVLAASRAKKKMTTSGENRVRLVCGLIRAGIDGTDPLRESVLMHMLRRGKWISYYRMPDGAPGGTGGQFAHNPGGGKKDVHVPELPEAADAPKASDVVSGVHGRDLSGNAPQAHGDTLVNQARREKIRAWTDDLSVLEQIAAKKRARQEAVDTQKLTDKQRAMLTDRQREQIAEHRRRLEKRFGVHITGPDDIERLRDLLAVQTSVIGHPKRGLRGEPTEHEIALARSLWNRQSTEAGHISRRENRVGTANRLRQAIDAVTRRWFGEVNWAPFRDEWNRIHARREALVNEEGVDPKVADEMLRADIDALAARVNPIFQNAEHPLYPGQRRSYPPPIVDGKLNAWWTEPYPWENDNYSPNEVIDDVLAARGLKRPEKSETTDDVDVVDDKIDDEAMAHAWETARLLMADKWIISGPREKSAVRGDVAMKPDPERIVDADVENTDIGRARQVMKVVDAVVRHQKRLGALVPAVDVYHRDIGLRLRSSGIATEDDVRSAVKKSRLAAELWANKNDVSDADRRALKDAHIEMSDILDKASTVIRKRARKITSQPEKRVGGQATQPELRSEFPTSRVGGYGGAAEREAKDAIDAAAAMMGKDISKGGAPRSRAVSTYGGASGVSTGTRGHRSLKGRPWRLTDEEPQPLPRRPARVGPPKTPSEIVSEHVDKLLRAEELLDKRRARLAVLETTPESERDSTWNSEYNKLTGLIERAGKTRKRLLQRIEEQPIESRQAVTAAVSRLLADVNRDDKSVRPRATPFAKERANQIANMLRTLLPGKAMTVAELEAEIRKLKAQRDRMPAGPERQRLNKKIASLASRIAPRR